MIAMRKNRVFGRRVYEPTPKDIRQACAKIQATWSPRERARRHRKPRVPGWTPPMIRLSDLAETIDAERGDNLPYAGAAGDPAGR
jgi:hypothetical protein